MPWTAGATRARRRRHMIGVTSFITAILLAAAAVIIAVDPLGTVTERNDGDASDPVAHGDGGGETPVVDPIDTEADGDDDAADVDTPADVTDGDDTAAPPEEPADAADTPDVPDDADDPAANADESDADADDTAHDDEGDDDAAEEPADDAVEEPADAGDTDDEEADLPDVEQVQQRLRELGYLIGAADGRAGQQTTSAVMAFQQVQGLAVDGIVGPATAAALDGDVVEPTLAGGGAERIEVDLTAQLLHVIEGGTRVVTLHVSSGSGGTYTHSSGGLARARTPVGDFVIERRIHGVRKADLGTLYDPLYFYRGFAIHGSPSVPAYPASHGCVRITRADAQWLIERVPDGTPVHVYGGTHTFAPSV